MKKEKIYFLDKAENVKRVIYIFYAVCILLFLADFVIERYTYHTLEKIPAFYAIFGFVACVVLVLVATQMRKFLMRGEDYYDSSEEKDKNA